jgi:hypothetical protein
MQNPNEYEYLKCVVLLCTQQVYHGYNYVNYTGRCFRRFAFKDLNQYASGYTLYFAKYIFSTYKFIKRA